MKYLQLTQSENPVRPSDGFPYIFYNHNINKVWIFFDLKWILEDGTWDMNKSWVDHGIWKMSHDTI